MLCGGCDVSVTVRVFQGSFAHSFECGGGGNHLDSVNAIGLSGDDSSSKFACACESGSRSGCTCMCVSARDSLLEFL